MEPLQFEGYDATVGTPNVVVDGSPNATTILTVSHWPGMQVPPGCAADTSAAMAMRYLDRGADLHGGATLVTNNHFDQDGLVGVYALSHPVDALRRRAQLEDLAAAGDFATCTERSSARLSMAISALADPSRTPIEHLPGLYPEACAVLYRTALELLPRWLEDPEACRSLWAEEDAELEAGLAAIASGAVRIEEQAEVDLAVVGLPAAGRSAGHRFAGRSFSGVHPIALHRATRCSTLLLLDDGGGRHRVTCRYEGWVQLATRRVPPRVDLRPLADRLDAVEPGGARWQASPPGELTPELHTDAEGPASSVDPALLTGMLIQHLSTSPPAWDPYAA